MDIGQVIEKRRKELGLTRPQLADLIGDDIRPQAVYEWERKGKQPESGKLPRIAQALKLPIAALYGASDGPNIWHRLTDEEKNRAERILNDAFPQRKNS